MATHFYRRDLALSTWLGLLSKTVQEDPAFFRFAGKHHMVTSSLGQVDLKEVYANDLNCYLEVFDEIPLKCSLVEKLLPTVARLRNVQDLDITYIESGDLEGLEGIVSLQKLHLQGAITIEGCKRVASLPYLTHLTLYNTAPGMEYLAQLPRLEYLSVSLPWRPGHYSLPNLQHLSVGGSILREVLKGFPTIKTLRAGALINFDILSECPHLEHLALVFEHPITLTGIQHLSKLRFLHLNTRKIDPDTEENLLTLLNLKTLVIQKRAITPHMVKHLEYNGVTVNFLNP